MRRTSKAFPPSGGGGFCGGGGGLGRPNVSSGLSSSHSSRLWCFVLVSLALLRGRLVIDFGRHMT
jgi:hypothetical protein